MRSVIPLLLCVSLMCGCASTKMRLALVDFDFRTPQQRVADVRENEVFYETYVATSKQEANENQEKALPLSFYEKALEVIGKLKARLRIFSLELSPVVVK